MSARFRIRTPGGQELSFGSEEMFADFVRSGDLSAEDLVYDAATNEWCSAFTHSFVLRLHSETSDGDERPRAAPEAGEGTVLEGFDLSPERTPEEEQAAFLAELEAERASETDRYETIRGLEVDTGGTGLLRGVPEEAPLEPARAEPHVGVGGSPTRTVPARRKDPAGGAARFGSTDPGRPRRRSPRAAPPPRVSVTFLVVALLLGAGGAFVLLGSDLASVVLGVPDLGPEMADDAPVLPDTEEALRARAAVRFLARSRDDLAVLPVIPATWLDGRYLSQASAYPEVREAWSRYREAAEAARANEARHYRTAYLSALDDARVTGPTRTLRLASAQAAFQDAAPTRVPHYERLAELAAAALALHDFLVLHEADIDYQPAVGTAVSTDPVLQAAAPDPVVQAGLEQALDRVLDALSARGAGPVEARAVRAWAFEGLRAIVDPQ